MKYGIVVSLSEECLKVMFAKELLKQPSEELTEAVKCIALANHKVPLDKWGSVECECVKDCLSDVYTFRLRAFTKIENFYEMKSEGSEYPKRYFKGSENA